MPWIINNSLIVVVVDVVNSFTFSFSLALDIFIPWFSSLFLHHFTNTWELAVVVCIYISYFHFGIESNARTISAKLQYFFLSVACRIESSDTFHFRVFVHYQKLTQTHTLTRLHTATSNVSTQLMLPYRDKTHTHTHVCVLCGVSDNVPRPFVHSFIVDDGMTEYHILHRLLSRWWSNRNERAEKWIHVILAQSAKSGWLWNVCVRALATAKSHIFFFSLSTISSVF